MLLLLLLLLLLFVAHGSFRCCWSVFAGRISGLGTSSPWSGGTTSGSTVRARVYMRVYVRVHACVRACVRACVHACVCESNTALLADCNKCECDCVSAFVHHLRLPLHFTEGFATFMETAGVNHLFPEWSMWKQFPSATREVARAADSVTGTHALHSPAAEVISRNDIDARFDTISYEKVCIPSMCLPVMCTITCTALVEGGGWRVGLR